MDKSVLGVKLIGVRIVPVFARACLIRLYSQSWWPAVLIDCSICFREMFEN